MRNWRFFSTSRSFDMTAIVRKSSLENSTREMKIQLQIHRQTSRRCKKRREKDFSAYKVQQQSWYRIRLLPLLLLLLFFFFPPTEAQRITSSYCGSFLELHTGSLKLTKQGHNLAPNVQAPAAISRLSIDAKPIPRKRIEFSRHPSSTLPLLPCYKVLQFLHQKTIRVFSMNQGFPSDHSLYQAAHNFYCPLGAVAKFC